MSGPYTKKLPLEVMQLALEVQTQLPRARLFVSDGAKVADQTKPQVLDPFLAVGLGEIDLEVIACWDEPDFTGKLNP